LVAKEVMVSRAPIDEQVAKLMYGSEFGDEGLKEFMTGELRQRLLEAEEEGRGLRVYCGYDVTAPDLHLGHTVTLRKLRHFQELGHDATLVVGTFTTLIGDASDRDTARTIRPIEEIRTDGQTYAEQAFRILDRERTAVRYNHDWLEQLSFRDVIRFASLFTVQQFLARDNFRKRYEGGDAIGLREFLYPFAQGYDAVALNADVQIGATEQLFNLMAGRKLQEHFGQRPQVCITLPILVGTDGRMRMSKSTGNYIGITEDPEEKYGKIMSLPDDAMVSYTDLLTRWSPAEANELKKGLAEGTIHPMVAKKMLAWEIVAGLDGDAAADTAADHFARVHQRGELPAEMPEFALAESMSIVDILYQAGLCQSKSEARRLIQQGGVYVDREALTEIDTLLEPVDAVIQVGKRRFLRLVKRE
jgi:tyrosyl-tRNA synthetase